MPEKTVSVLGIAVPNESPTFLVLVVVHVTIALAAVVAGLGAMSATKGIGRHSRLGSLYYWLLCGVFVTATVLAAMRWAHDWHLFVLGALAFASAAVGRRSLRQRSHGRLSIHLSAMGASYILLLTAFYVDNGKNLPLWKELPPILYWTVPSIIGIPIIVRALRRHPLIRGSHD